MRRQNTKTCTALQASPLQAHTKQICFSGKHKKKDRSKNNHPATATKHDRKQKR